jgi:hypothetical protein
MPPLEGLPSCNSGESQSAASQLYTWIYCFRATASESLPFRGHCLSHQAYFQKQSVISPQDDRSNLETHFETILGKANATFAEWYERRGHQASLCRRAHNFGFLERRPRFQCLLSNAALSDF